MADPCLTIDEIGSVAHASRDDPRQRHVAECPRCRMLLRSYESFMRGDLKRPVPEGLGELLDVARHRAIFGAGHGAGDLAAEPSSAATPAGHAPGAVHRWRMRFAGLFRPRFAGLAAVTATAVVLLVIGLLPVNDVRSPRSTDVILREAGDGEDQVLAADARQLEPGAWQLSWSEPDTVDAYQVRILDSDLSERHRLSAPSPRSMVVRRSDLPDGLQSQPFLFWQVLALRGGDVIARSRVQALPSR